MFSRFSRSSKPVDGASSPNKRGFEYSSHLMAACSSGAADEVQRLLSAGADPNHRGEFGATPLIRAALEDARETLAARAA